MKLCKDCKWHHDRGIGDELANCMNPQAEKYRAESLVTGRKSMIVITCWATRLSVSRCGPEGLWFETAKMDQNSSEWKIDPATWRSIPL